MLYTIGHSTRAQDELFDMLSKHSIDRLVDVRLYPGSKYCPQWNADNIAGSIPDGIEYVPFKILGGRRRPLPERKTVNGAWRNKSFRAYADYMQTQEFDEAFNDLRSLTERYNCAIMCAEALWWRCHRSLISDAYVANGGEVFHIMGNGLSRHKLRDFAVITDGRVSYPKI